jgi:hypothetical protein
MMVYLPFIFILVAKIPGKHMLEELVKVAILIYLTTPPELGLSNN